LFHLFNPVTTTNPKKKRGKLAENEESRTCLKENGDESQTDRPGPTASDKAELEGPDERESPMFVRKPGESKKDFFERIDMETKIKVADCMRKERKSDRRKR